MKLLDTPLRDEPIATYSGKLLSLRTPEVAQIDIEDIAHGLAYQCRSNGQVRYFYSLAQHCLLVASLVPPSHRLTALLHEAAAAYLGEPGAPWWRLVPDAVLVEKRLMAVVSEKFGLGDYDAPAIRRAHQVVVATEQRDLQRVPPDGGMILTPGQAALQPVPIPRRIDFMPPEEARYQFIEMFTALQGKRRSSTATVTPMPAMALSRKTRSKQTLTLVGKP